MTTATSGKLRARSHLLLVGVLPPPISTRKQALQGVVQQVGGAGSSNQQQAAGKQHLIQQVPGQGEQCHLLMRVSPLISQYAYVRILW